jgi:hypothetical protein
MTGPILHRWQEEDKKHPRESLIFSTDAEVLASSPPPAYGICTDTDCIWFDTSLWRHFLIAAACTQKERILSLCIHGFG